MLECNYCRGCNRFQVGHGFSNVFDCPLKIKVLIENLLSLKWKAEISASILSGISNGRTILYKSKELPTKDAHHSLLTLPKESFQTIIRWKEVKTIARNSYSYEDRKKMYFPALMLNVLSY